mmetsp:Transcript_39122/g.93934  ORF Transcript_39122/g.93934 Transcript_39122/m.93934 type:complete len:237 (-) Transcript_39122:216-926(-)
MTHSQHATQQFQLCSGRHERSQQHLECQSALVACSQAQPKDVPRKGGASSSICSEKNVAKPFATLGLRVLLHRVVERSVHAANTGEHVVVLVHTADVHALDDAQNMLEDLPLLGSDLRLGLLRAGSIIGERGAELQVTPDMSQQHDGPGQREELQGTLDDRLVILLDQLGLAEPSISINHQEGGQSHLVRHLRPVVCLQSLHQSWNRVQLLANSVRPSRGGERPLKGHGLLVGALE